MLYRIWSILEAMHHIHEAKTVIPALLIPW